MYPPPVDPGRRQILRRVPTFADLDDDDCDAVLAVLRARRGAPGDVLFREGEPGDTLLVVLEGQLVASVAGSGGAPQEVARLGPGEVVGEMAFVDAEARSATVQAPPNGSGTTVLEFSRAALAHLRRTAPRVAASIQRNVLRDVARRLRDAGERLTEGSGRSLRDAGDAGPPSLRRAGRGLTAAQLRTIPALAAYGAEDLDLLAYIATLRSFAAREVLMAQGTEGDACFLLVTGEVAVSRGGPGSSPAGALATLGPGALVGQLALLDRAPRSATVTALVDTMALEVREDAFANLVRASSPIALRFQEQVALAGVRQLRVATRSLAASAERESLSPLSSGRMLDVDDWDDAPLPALELDVDPSYSRR